MEDHTPLWALAAGAAIVTLCGAGYAVVKLWYHILDRRLEYRMRLREVETSEQETERRNAASEAWEVVDRLTEELEKVTPKIEALQLKCDEIREEGDRREREANIRAERCEADHAGTKKILRVVVAWGKQRGMKLDPLLEVEIQRNSTDGSGVQHSLKVLPPPPSPDL